MNSTGLYNRGGSPSVQQRCSLKHSRERTAMLQAMATQIGYAATYCIPNRAEFCPGRSERNSAGRPALTTDHGRGPTWKPVPDSRSAIRIIRMFLFPPISAPEFLPGVLDVGPCWTAGVPKGFPRAQTGRYFKEFSPRRFPFKNLVLFSQRKAREIIPRSRASAVLQPRDRVNRASPGS